MITRKMGAFSLHRATGISLERLGMWISGRAVPRKLEWRHKLAEALGVTYNDLFADVGRAIQQNLADVHAKQVDDAKKYGEYGKTAKGVSKGYVSKIGYIKPLINDWAKNGRAVAGSAKDKPVCRKGQYCFMRRGLGDTDRCCSLEVCLVSGK